VKKITGSALDRLVDAGEEYYATLSRSRSKALRSCCPRPIHWWLSPGWPRSRGFVHLANRARPLRQRLDVRRVHAIANASVGHQELCLKLFCRPIATRVHPPSIRDSSRASLTSPCRNRIRLFFFFFFFLFMFAQHEATSRIRGQGPLHGITRALFGVQCCRRNPAQPSLLRKIGGKVGMKRQAVVDHSTGWISSSPSVPTLTLSSPTTSCSSPNPRHG